MSTPTRSAAPDPSRRQPPTPVGHPLCPFRLAALLVPLAGLTTVAAQSPCAVGFTPAAGSPTAVTTPQDVAIGDIDGVHGLDAVVTSPLSNQIVVLLNDGSGSLAPSPGGPLGFSSQPSTLALADFDGANGDDILVLEVLARQATVLYNDGSGAFPTRVTLATLGQPGALAAANFDGQNGLDVVIAEYTSSGLSIFLADGSGGFGPRRFGRLPGPFGLVSEVAVGDFDGRNGPDLVAATTTGPATGAIHVFLNDGTGRFTTAPGSPYGGYRQPVRPAVAELDGAPGDDIAFLDLQFNTASAETLLNDGTGAFSTGVPTVLTGFPEDVQLADVDGSGHADIVVMSSGEGLQLFLNGGNGAFQPSADGTVDFGARFPEDFALGDLDGQLGPDLVTVATSDSAVHVLHNAMATAAVAGQNLLSIHAAGGSMLPAGVACPTLDLSAGGTFAFDVEGRAPGLPVFVVLQLGPCTTRPGGALPFGPIPGAMGYSIDTNCASGSNRVLNLARGGAPVQGAILPLTFDPVRMAATVQWPFNIPAGSGTMIVSAQAVVVDGAVPDGLVLTNAFNLRL